MNRDAILAGLLDALWAHYKMRVTYARQYQKMVLAQGGKLINDHIAFRTFNAKTGEQPPGVEAIARVFVPLGYERKDKYVFEDKMLTAWHYEHKDNPENPKIFISQMEIDKDSASVATLIRESVGRAPDLLSSVTLDDLESLQKGGEVNENSSVALIKNLARYFVRPWKPPNRSAIEPVNKESQYAAWTLLNGNSVNHFTAYINGQNVAEWPDLETTVKALREAGVPMKDELEGEAGSKLRQCSTRAVDAECEVTEEDGSVGKMKWSYAYYEFAERGKVPGAGGKPELFQGFVGAQATNFFEMTKRG